MKRYFLTLLAGFWAVSLLSAQEGTDSLTLLRTPEKQNYEALTNRLAATGVPYAARLEKAGHCQILFRKPKTRPWLFDNMKRFLGQKR